MMKGEVNVLDQTGIEGLRILYPELYTMVRDNKIMFTTDEDPEDYPVFARCSVVAQDNGDALEARVTDARGGMNRDEGLSGKKLVQVLFKQRPPRKQGVVRRRHFDRYRLCTGER
jgi:hypothetical protein